MMMSVHLDYFLCLKAQLILNVIGSVRTGAWQHVTVPMVTMRESGSGCGLVYMA